ncbi:MAG: hypothetical protein ACI81P_003663, partial [Neolewinella sp.]
CSEQACCFCLWFPWAEGDTFTMHFMMFLRDQPLPIDWERRKLLVLID